MSSLDPVLQTIFDDLDGAPARPSILLEPRLDQTAQGRRLLALAQELERLGRGRLTVRAASSALSARPDQADDEALDELVAPEEAPGLRLGADGRWPIRYLAVPEGHQAPPFREALLILAGLAPRPEGAWCDALAAMAEPATIDVFVAPACPHCPAAVGTALTLAGLARSLEVTVIDAEAHPETAAAAGARSVPRTVVDGGLGLVGLVPPATLAQHLLDRGTATHRRAILEAWIAGSAFGEAAQALEADHEMRLALAELWRRSTLSSRLGLMMAVEELLGTAPRALDDLVPDLVPALAADEAPLRGDTVDLLARIGNRDAAAAIHPLVDDPDPDVAEAAAEAIQELAAG
jgi:glutaredoxin